jgi:hypothetical protein
MALSKPIWLQNQTYSARLDRTFADVLFTEGVIDPGGGAFLVSERAIGANNSVDIAVGVAVVEGDDESFQGKYVIRNENVVNLPLGPAPTVDPRIDVVILEVNDSVAGSVRTPADVANLTVVQGVVDPSPLAPAVPATAIALAEILRTPGDSFIDNLMITDARPASLQAQYTVNSNFEILTTAERDALTPFVGQTIFNSTDDVVQYYDGTGWSNIGFASVSTLTDVDLTSLADGDILTYDNFSGDWVTVDRASFAADPAFSALYVSVGDVLALSIALGG